MTIHSNILPSHMRGRREKCFGYGRPIPLDRNAKARITTLARALSRRTEAGKAYGILTAKFLAVLQALLWGFHNSRDGRCFPSYEAIAERAGCARSTVHEAICALEGAGILSWVNRIVRVREAGRDLFGRAIGRWRVLRTSNAYAFRDPGAGTRPPPVACGIRPKPSKSEKPTGTPVPVLDPLSDGLAAALGRLRSAMEGGRRPSGTLAANAHGRGC